MSGYKIVGELGHGGMGVVYKARDLQRNEFVALKTMQRIDSEHLHRFKKEFRALAGVTHRNLVALYDMASDGNVWYFTMELVEGVPFCAPSCSRTDNGAGQGIDLDRLRDTMRQLAEGVAALHGAGKLHRDIKPSNALVTREGRVVLLDFGLVAHLDPSGLHQSTEQHVLGTVAYMAPEQAACLPVTPAADWYSVGVVLYEALTGQRPFRGSVVQILQDKQHREAPVPQTSNPEVPADLNALCAALLRRLPQERPSGAEVLERLGHKQSVSIAATPPRKELPLLGRERHLSLLEEAYAESRQRQAVLAAVHGPSGMGKSVLVAHFLDRLRRRGALVLAGRCYERESVPYKALDPVVDELGRYLRGLTPAEVEARLPRDVGPLTRVFPVLGRVRAVAEAASRSSDSSDLHEVRRRAFAGLRDLLARVGDRQPLVLHIDDLQWGDVDSALLLGDLLQPPDPPALLLLVSYRSEDAANPCLRALARTARKGESIDWRDLALTPLIEEEARALVNLLLGAGAETHAAAIARETGGNPFFITELVQEMLSRESAASEPTTNEVTVEGLIRARIARLPEGSRRLLEVVAVSGRPLAAEMACRAAELDKEGRVFMAQLQSTRLVRRTGSEEDTVETYHDRIREAIVADLKPEILQACHRRLAMVLEESGRADPEELGVHFEVAADRQKAGAWYARAAERAVATLAFDRAANLYQQALGLLDVTGEEVRELRIKLADALANAGRGAEAGPAYLTASAGAATREMLELRRRAADQFLLSGHTQEGLEVLRTVLSAVGLRLAKGPRRALLALFLERLRLRLRGLHFQERAADLVPAEELLRIDVCYTASHRLTMFDVTQSAFFQTRQLLLALRAGEPSRIAFGLAAEAAHVALVGGSASSYARTVLNRSMALAKAIDQPLFLAIATLMGSIIEWSVGRWKEGLLLCSRAEAIAVERQVGFAGEITKIRHFALDCLAMLGEWREMGCRLPGFLKDAQERNDPFSASVMLVHSYVPCLASGEPDQAEETIRHALEVWPQEGFFMVSYWALYGRAETALYCGEGRRAWDLIEREWSSLTRSTFVEHIQMLFLLMIHLRARAALAAAAVTPCDGWLFGSRERLLRSATRDARKIERRRMSWATPLAHLVRAGIAALRKRKEEALTLLAMAEKGFAEVDMKLYAAAASRQRGQLLGGEEGRALMVSTDAIMANENIRNSARIAAMLAPGLPDRGL